MKLKRDARKDVQGPPGEGRVVRVLVCPECGGHNVIFDYSSKAVVRRNVCHDCGYMGSFVIERGVVVGDGETVEEV